MCKFFDKKCLRKGGRDARWIGDRVESVNFDLGEYGRICDSHMCVCVCVAMICMDLCTDEMNGKKRYGAKRRKGKGSGPSPNL